MLEKIPFMKLRDSSPAFYDSEPATVLELCSKLHGRVNEIVEAYNQFIDTINERITTYEAAHIQDKQTFETALRQEFQDFIDTIDLKIASIEIGVSPTVDVAQISGGYRITITDAEGTKTAEVMNAVLTDEDKEDLTNRVLEALPQAEEGEF